MPRGVITRYDPSSGTGIITAEDGTTYPFRIADAGFGARPSMRGVGGSMPSADGADAIPARRRQADDNDKD